MEDGHLCEDYALTRWFPHTTGPECVISIHRGSLVSVDDSLEYVAAEATYIEGWGNITRTDPTLRSVLQLLETGDYGLLHFASHGTYRADDPNQSTIELADGKLRPRDIVGARRNFDYCRPLVFLNTCHLSSQGQSLTGIGGWAQAFLQAGANIFVGANWEINDELAFTFSREFYSALRNGETVGEATVTARNAIRRNNDPTWLSYVVYAHPYARARMF